MDVVPGFRVGVGGVAGKKSFLFIPYMVCK